MSLPYDRRSLTDTFARLDALGYPLGDEVVTAWRAGQARHSDPACVPNLQMEHIALRTWAADLEASSQRFTCSCGSLRGTAPGSFADALALSLQALDAEKVRYTAKSWSEVDAWLSIASWPLLRHVLQPRKQMEVALEPLGEKIAAAASLVAVRSISSLDPAPLYGAIAAQGLIVPIKPSLGSFFERWASRRIENVTYASLEPGASSTPTRREADAPLFDSALSSALADTTPGILVVALGRALDLSVTLPEMRAARMFLMRAGLHSPKPDAPLLTCVRLPATLASGLHSILSSSGLSVDCGSDPIDEVTLELASRLWAPSDRGPLSRLDGAVAAARLLK